MWGGERVCGVVIVDRVCQRMCQRMYQKVNVDRACQRGVLTWCLVLCCHCHCHHLEHGVSGVVVRRSTKPIGIDTARVIRG